jgi:UDP-N-acetyl-D-glucosamine dehydrogenase
MAYKRDIDDVRESPSLDVMRLLVRKGADVMFHDPYVSEVRDESEIYKSMPLSDRLLSSCDCVVIATDHQVIDYGDVVSKAALVVDTRNATRNISADNVVGLSGSVAGEARVSGDAIAAIS